MPQRQQQAPYNIVAAHQLNHFNLNVYNFMHPYLCIAEIQQKKIVIKIRMQKNWNYKLFFIYIINQHANRTYTDFMIWHLKDENIAFGCPSYVKSILCAILYFFFSTKWKCSSRRNIFIWLISLQLWKISMMIKIFFKDGRWWIHLSMSLYVNSFVCLFIAHSLITHNVDKNSFTSRQNDTFLNFNLYFQRNQSELFYPFSKVEHLHAN